MPSLSLTLPLYVCVCVCLSAAAGRREINVYVANLFTIQGAESRDDQEINSNETT